MSNIVTVTPDELVQHIKLAGKVPAIVEEILTQQVVMTAAAAAGITATTEELQQAADQLRFVQKLRRAEETFAWLQKHALTLDEFEEMARRSVISMKLAHHLFGDKVEPYFVEHQLDYLRVNLYEVILEDEDLAMELFYALKEEEISFFDVAQQYIQDPALRRVGGFRGELRRNDLKPEISAAVFAASPPQLLQPIITAKGIHLILVDSLIRPELTVILKAQILSDLFSKWIKQQIQQIDEIEVL